MTKYAQIKQMYLKACYEARLLSLSWKLCIAKQFFFKKKTIKYINN